MIKTGAVVVLARALGPEEFGTFILFFSLAALVTLFSDIGVSQATARRLAEDPSNSRDTVKTGLLLVAIPLAVLACAAFFSLDALGRVLGAPQLGALRGIFLLYFLSTIAIKFSSKLFEGLRRVDVSGRAGSVGSTIPWLVCLGLVYWGQPNAAHALIGLTLGTLVFACLLAILAWRVVQAQPVDASKPSVRWQALMGYAAPMIVTTLSLYIYTNSDIVLIQYFLDESAVGIFGTAVRIIEILHVPSVAVGSAVAAFFIHMRNSRPGVEGRLFVAVTRGLVVLYLPAAAALFLFANALVPAIFGGEYAAAGAVAMVYMPFLFLKALSGTYSQALDYLGFVKQRAIAVGISAFANVALNIYLIPRYGILGAAIGTQVTYTPLALWYAWLLAKDTKASIPKVVNTLARTGAAVLGATLAAVGLHLVAPNVLAEMILFAGVYAVLVVVLKVIQLEDRRFLMNMLGGGRRAAPIVEDS